VISDQVWLALITAVPPTVAAIGGIMLSMRNSRKLDEVKDGMQSKMMEAQHDKGVADGKAEGIASERDRNPSQNSGVIPTGMPGDPVIVKQE
jgi:hypothetical protein